MTYSIIITIVVQFKPRSGYSGFRVHIINLLAGIGVQTKKQFLPITNTDFVTAFQTGVMVPNNCSI